MGSPRRVVKFTLFSLFACPYAISLTHWFSSCFFVSSLKLWWEFLLIFYQPYTRTSRSRLRLTRQRFAIYCRWVNRPLWLAPHPQLHNYYHQWWLYWGLVNRILLINTSRHRIIYRSAIMRWQIFRPILSAFKIDHCSIQLMDNGTEVGNCLVCRSLRMVEL